MFSFVYLYICICPLVSLRIKKRQFDQRLHTVYFIQNSHYLSSMRYDLYQIIFKCPIVLKWRRAESKLMEFSRILLTSWIKDDMKCVYSVYYILSEFDKYGAK